MSASIGETLGVMLALFQEDLSSNPDNLEMLDRIHKISEVYRNFTEPEFGQFCADFEKGYVRGKQGIEFDNEPLRPTDHLNDDPAPG